MSNDSLPYGWSWKSPKTGRESGAVFKYGRVKGVWVPPRLPALADKNPSIMVIDRILGVSLSYTADYLRQWSGNRLDAWLLPEDPANDYNHLELMGEIIRSAVEMNYPTPENGYGNIQTHALFTLPGHKHYNPYSDTVTINKSATVQGTVTLRYLYGVLQGCYMAAGMKCPLAARFDPYAHNLRERIESAAKRLSKTVPWFSLNLRNVNQEEEVAAALNVSPLYNALRSTSGAPALPPIRF